jgi:hypothetical protein
MYKLIAALYFCFGISLLSAKCSEVPLSIKTNYASSMHNAFWLQAHGKSTLAGLQFQSACEEAKKAGESALRIGAVEQLFTWYRMYGSSLNLFLTKPTGTDRILGEYKPAILRALNSNPPFQSEWGKTPEQAAQVRDFMVGVGEVISGIFCVTVSTGWGITIGFGAVYNGCDRMYTALNNIWAGHQAMIALKQWEQGPLKTVQEQ